MASGSQTTPVPMTPLRLARKILFTYLALMVTVACITILFLSMRSVMEIGGTCASGGPYVVANPCPKGTGWMMMGAIWGGLISLAFYIGNDSGLPGPKWWPLAWPALFLSLGWNFWEYGLNPPEQFGEDVGWSWIICGVLFVLMGAAPLFAVVNKDFRTSLLWADAADDEPRSTPKKVAKAAAPTMPRKKKPQPRSQPAREARPTVSTPTSGPPPDNPYGPSPDDTVGDLAEDLERLSRLHQEGHLTDSEFRAAKARRIAGYES
jgi:hypothetical protein